MKFVTILLTCFMLATISKVKAQDKKIIQDTVYYHLDTAAIPIKDRVFQFDIEGSCKEYILACKCYPGGSDLVFISWINRPNWTKNISLDSFNKIKTISITELINIAVQYAKDKIDRHKLFFIEPNDKNMKVTAVYLAEPLKSRAPSICSQIVRSN
ncbi:hypothetical protein [Pedobacter cryoconitis]|uniref:Uncharacterized protein n=1 Tax=Pedobacter cryoconitis TaxID=188932 RepID=A0A7X0MGW1_9SPHI|nr:hypothetical protein [Pedobacter cryoconitis]MBB6498484.1 hypothetical protein [Pedobacter cryoconitis]